MKTSFLKSVFIWLVTTLFIFATLYPVLITTVFVEDVTKTEIKTVIKTTPKEVNTSICYVNKNGKNYHDDACKYVGNAVKTTIYEAKREGYGECRTCKWYDFAETILIVEEETKTVTQTEKEATEYNYFYPLLICSPVSFLVFVCVVLIPSKKEKA